MIRKAKRFLPAFTSSTILLVYYVTVEGSCIADEMLDLLIILG